MQRPNGERITISLGARKTVFGRYPQPHTNVCLADREMGPHTEVARYHFEIRWETHTSTHVVVDYGQRFPIRLNGEALRKAERTLKVGDLIEIGAFGLNTSPATTKCRRRVRGCKPLRPVQRHWGQGARGDPPATKPHLEIGSSFRAVLASLTLRRI